MVPPEFAPAKPPTSSKPVTAALADELLMLPSLKPTKPPMLLPNAPLTKLPLAEELKMLPPLFPTSPPILSIR
jgi:hypothetical protein